MTRIWQQVCRQIWQQPARRRLMQRSLQCLLGFSLALSWSLAMPTWAAFPSVKGASSQTPVTTIIGQSLDPTELEAQARAHYQNGEYTTAAQLFQQAADLVDSPWQRGALLANVSLAYQQNGAWQLAQDSIDAAQQQVMSLAQTKPEMSVIAAQVHDIEARLLLSRGQPEAAAVAWAAAATAYEQGDRLPQVWQAQLSQAQALQAAGFYRRSVDLLTELTAVLVDQPASELTVQASYSLGEALRLTGSLSAADEQLQRSLQQAQALALSDDVSIAYRSLGNLARLQGAKGNNPVLVSYYDQAVATAVSPLVSMQARLARLRLWIDEAQWQLAYEEGRSLWEARSTLPTNRGGLYAQIELLQQLEGVREAIAVALLANNVADPTPWQSYVQPLFEPEIAAVQRQASRPAGSLSRRTVMGHVIGWKFPSVSDVVPEVATLRERAQILGDAQAEATLLGVLGRAYEDVEDWDAAAQVTQAGLVLAQSQNLGQVAYALQAQLGEIQLAQGDRAAALSAYRASVQTLQGLREDVVSVSSEAQYSFQKSIEPIYRELAALLLEDSTDGTISVANLKQAREVIELLQLSELDNFFREACLNGNPIEIDAIDSQAAVLYPILLPDRLDIVVSLPGGDFQHFPVAVDPDELAQTLQALRLSLETPQSDLTTRGVGVVPTEGAPRTNEALQVLPAATQLYDWLIRPVEDALAASQPKTLVFVLDGSLRSVPMSVLYDGSQFLIEKYAVVLTPGLQLINPQPLPKENLSVIAAGLSEIGEAPRAENFSPLPYVQAEVETIGQYFPSTTLLNEAFDVASFEIQVGSRSAPIVHLATHGQFGSNLEDTFVLTWDDQLSANRFSNILLTSELSREAAIELLVLSACETAKGDDLAVLGLAGIAMRSGARSTLASFWQVSDPATAQLMGEFYRALGTPELTKAESIRQAQLTLLQDPEYRHPYYWSAFVLVGNWL